MYNRILKRPMFKRGGSSFQAQGTGITSPYDTPRKKYNIGSWGEWEDATRKATKDPRGDFSYAAQGFSHLGDPYKESGEAKMISEMLHQGAGAVRASKEKATDLERSGELAILQSKGDRILAEETHKKQKELAQIKAANLLNKDYSPSRSIQELQKEIFKQSDDFSFEKQNSFGLAQGMYYISKLLEANPSEQVDIISIWSPQDNEGKVFGFDETKLVVDKVWWDPKMKRWAVFGDTDGDGYANGAPQYFGSYNEASIALVKGISTTNTTNNADNPNNIKTVNEKGEPIKKSYTQKDYDESIVTGEQVVDVITNPKTWEGTVGGDTRGYGVNQNIAQKATGGRVGYEEGTPDPEIKELDMLTNWWKENLSGWNKNEG
ncbi:uncharacterized protein METZ01_LOCUS83463 [marine metagenome]|uniref:Uncharacterized protein n=1 Tax=marine metagenome TaxID=408172 RepID=A0A381UR14_9ZZZZ